MKKLPVFLTLSAVLLLGAGCASKPASDTKAPAASGTPAASAPSGVAPTGEPATKPTIPDAPSTGSTLPDNFPKDIPIFPAAYITSWDVNDNRSYVMFFSTDKTGQDTIDWYDQKLTAAGFTQTYLDGNVTEGFSATYEKDLVRLNLTTGLDATGGYKSSMTIYRYPLEAKTN